MEPELQATWKRVRLTLAEYHQLIASGAIPEDDRVELIEGHLVSKEPRTGRRSISTWLTRTNLSHVVPAAWYVDSGEPVTLGEDSEPEPDVVVVRGNTRDYRDQHPGAGDLALAVDVVEAPGSDLEARKRVYARAGVPVCWVINLADTRIEVYSDLAITAGEAGYRRRTDFTASDEIPVVIEGREVRRFTVRELTSL